MDTSRPARSSFGRFLEYFALAIALVGCLGIGYWLGIHDHLKDPPPSPLYGSQSTEPKNDAAAANSQIDAPRPVVLQQPEAAALESRAKAIDSTKETILAECQKAAGGDWDRWESETEHCRSALRTRLVEMKPFDPIREYWMKEKPQALAGKAGFPLFEIYPRESLEYLYNPPCLDQFRHDRAVLAAHRWLSQRGIDLIFVAIPSMPEVYIEHFIDATPPDGIIAPRVRRLYLDLLMENVEVVDGRTLFRPVREPDPEYLYNTADTHWAPRGMRIMAKEIAARIQRYQFGAKAKSSPPIVKAAPGPFDIQHAASAVIPGNLPNMDGWWTLKADEQLLATPAQTRTVMHVTMPDGREPPDDPQSPILLIGHSYILNFREQLIKETNILPKTRMTAGQTTESFAEFLRQPDYLDGCRVVIWITNGKYLPRFTKMPSPIMRALEEAK
jgi:hypothetical protein